MPLDNNFHPHDAGAMFTGWVVLIIFTLAAALGACTVGFWLWHNIGSCK